MRDLLLLAVGIVLLGADLGAAQDLTFNRDVAPILYRHCVGCHRPGEIAPFPLLTYDDAARRARLIASAVKERRMPPWKPEPNYGDFQGVRRLTDSEIATITRWAAAGATRGDSPAPRPPAPPGDGWVLGTPDVVLKMTDAFAVPATGQDIYQCFVLPLNLPEDMPLTAVEFKPGNRRVLHHSISFVDTRRVGRWRDGGSQEPGYRCFGGAGVSALAMVTMAPACSSMRAAPRSSSAAPTASRSRA